MTGQKHLVCRVILLDDTVPEFQVPRKALGEELYDLVFKQLQLLESDYFGLECKNSEQVDEWLDREKPILYQTGRDHELSFKFKVKFYTPDPNLFEDEFTRYLFALQIKQDLATGKLTCNMNTTAILSAYIAQAELGDYHEEEMPDHSYLKCISFVPNQSDELEQAIMQFHRGFGGMTPSDADFHLLDTARKTDYYGIVPHPAMDHEGVALQLAVTETGIYVYQNSQRINTFSWAKIRKLSFKRKRLLIKLHPAAEQAYYKNTVEFFFSSRNGAKAFWKLSVEHHSFFRRREVSPVKRHKRAVLTRGSSFRYTGRTQKQLLDHVKENFTKGRSFERTLSARHTVAGNRSFVTSRSATLNSKREFNADVSTLSSGSHLIGGSDSQHSEFKSPSHSSHTPPVGRVSAAQSPPIVKPSAPGAQTSPGTSIKDRNFSEPHLSKSAQARVEDNRLARTPDYSNIPDKVEELQTPLVRSDSIGNIPKGVELDAHAEPKSLQHRASAGVLPRIHSENDTEAMGKHPRDVSTAVNVHAHALSNNEGAQFSMGSNDLLNGQENHTNNKEESRKAKKLPSDKAYFIAKEFLMTERTYHKDLAIVTKNFRDFMADEVTSQETLGRLFELLEPIYDMHCALMDSLENRLNQYDNRPSDSLAVNLGDIAFSHFQKLDLYKSYLCDLEELLTRLVKLTETNEQLAKKLGDFEMEKTCYLPVFSLLLKPAHRLVYYEILLSKLIAHYNAAHRDYNDCKQSLAVVTECLGSLRSSIAELENTEKLIELHEDISGIEDLVHQGRYFIREGCLQKLSRRGYQQRLFILLSDVLLYTSRTQSSQLQFRVHGYMPVVGMTLEESDPNRGVPNSFTIYSANRCLIVAANSQEEKDKWIEDLHFAISIANSDQIELVEMPLPQITPSNGTNSEGDLEEASASPDNVMQTQHRANTTMHVCWHRNTSVSIKDIQNAIKHQLSGYLLRKFKNSNGWQKLWVVFTNFCLFFYKTYQDEFPLASLPLLGYSVSKPAISDNVNKDFVFKLQFKNHVYFFRAESEYTYDRWIEVINSATHSSRRTRMFSRMDSVA